MCLGNFFFFFPRNSLLFFFFFFLTFLTFLTFQSKLDSAKVFCLRIFFSFSSPEFLFLFCLFFLDFLTFLIFNLFRFRVACTLHTLLEEHLLNTEQTLSSLYILFDLYRTDTNISSNPFFPILITILRRDTSSVTAYMISQLLDANAQQEVFYFYFFLFLIFFFFFIFWFSLVLFSFFIFFHFLLFFVLYFLLFLFPSFLRIVLIFLFKSLNDNPLHKSFNFMKKEFHQNIK